MKTPSLSRLALLGALTTLAAAAHASCGSAFCSLMSDRYAQGSGQPHLGWSADLRLEYVTLDQLTSGTHSVSAATAAATEDAVETRTQNLNVLTTLDYGIDANWSLSLRIPVVKRHHLHETVDAITRLPNGTEDWNFTRLGDVQVTARRQFASADTAFAWAFFGGFKLPTGTTEVVNSDGTRAERALQPGTGTTDAVLGVAGRHATGMRDAIVGQASWTQALNSSEDFKPGTRLELSAGWSHAFSGTLGSVLQLNFRQRGRDSGAQAEPDNSGSTTVNLSPGLTVTLGEASTLYAYVQLPVYQHVNGIQLVPRSALAVGWTHDF
jgi:hypothetical protein